MKAERFRQIRNLFDATMGRDPGARNAFLIEACEGDEELLVEVGKLLAAQGQPTSWIDESVLGQPLLRFEGSRIGPYEVLRQLGEGGMGAVYLAAHDDGGSRKLVALKIVRPDAISSDVLRRFKREGEILESLDHPNIARILGGGTTTDGLPYLVMDYVDGVPIDKYCHDKQLDLSARVKLFRDVCAAVQYAHEHHVVHRDLKPSNILVTEQGVVRLLDFGIARMAASGPDGPTCLTRSDMLLMTPEYASPEQVSGVTVTPASDVYALGVILYELLTGRRPYRLRSRLFREIVRVICEEAPERPSAAVVRKDEGAAPRIRASSAELQKGLSGNIDSILLKTLAKDPLQRYASARQLSEDLRLHGEGRTAEARRHAALNTAGEFMRRNGWWLGALAAISLAMYTRVVVLPPGAVFIVSAVALVFIGGYYLAVWERGEDYARTTLTGLAKMLPVTAILMIGEYLYIGRYAGFFASSNLFLFSICIGFCVLTLLHWSKRTRLGPLVFEFNARLQKNVAWIGLGILGLFTVVAILKDEGVQGLRATGPLFASLLAFDLLAFVIRGQIRQRGLVLYGRPVPWTKVVSYAWEPGRGRIEGKCDILRLRVRKSSRINLDIPVEARNRIDELLKQQLTEWPL